MSEASGEQPRTLPAAFVAALADALGAEFLLRERSDCERYERGWRYGRGRAAAVVRPRTPEEVASVLRLAREHGVRVHAIGANTGMVGASNPDSSGEQLVLSFERLRAHIDIDQLDLERTGGDTLTAFEVISREALSITLERGADVRDPFRGERPALTALVELSTTLAPERLDLDALLEDQLAAFCETSERAEELSEVLVGRAEDFWSIRHQISESLAREGRVLALDLSVPRSQLAAFSAEARALVARLNAAARVCDFGHWGDGGTHFNVVLSTDTSDAAARELQSALYELCVTRYSGSYSAEHGIGPHNAADWRRYTPEILQATRRALRNHFG